MKDTVKELTLMLLYLTSWKDKDIGTRSWKGYDFDILNELSQEEFIVGSYKAKSVHITEEGVIKAKELIKKFGIEE